MKSKPTATNSSPSTAKSTKRKYRLQRIVLDVSHWMVLILSVMLIVFISYDTFNDIPFLSNHSYMTFQFWVCVAFLVDFFIELFVAVDKLHYLKMRWFFLIISIPYLNIVNLYHLQLTEQMLFYLRFIPLLRGAYALAMVMGYISHNRAVSLMWQYVAMLFALIYCLSLIFYYEEHAVNHDVHSFWDALYWACMNTTTVGCYINPVTPIGKIISVILPTSGMLILPLFTVAVTSKIQNFDKRFQIMEQLFIKNDQPESPSDTQAAQAKKELIDDLQSDSSS